MHSGILRSRHLAVLFIFLAILSSFTARLAFIQIIEFPFYSAIAKDQHTVSIPLEPRRGTIFDRNMRVLAVNLNIDSVFANPREIKDKVHAARSLASCLGLKEGLVRDRLSRDKGFVWIKRKITPEESSAVKAMKLKGVDMLKESKRFYPNGELACHVLGTADIDNNGMEGVELVYDRYLKGSQGWLVSTQDGKRRKVVSYQHEHIPPRDGANLVLTLDEVVQHIAEQELEAAYKKHNARGASIVVMDPGTGDILAMASLPNYDLNHFKTRSTESLKNRAVCDFFEPGSIFKVVTASALLEEGAVRLDDKFFCENGSYRVGRRTIHDHRPHGVLTFKEVIEKSSNIGTIKAASRIGADKMYKYISSYS